MTAGSTASEVLGAVPGFAAAEVEAELSGLTNRSFRLRLGNERFVLRLDAPHTAAIPLDRAAERRAQDRAARAGLAPEIVFADADAGISITRFLDGRSVTREDFMNAGFLDRLAGLLRAVHSLEPIGRPFEAYAAAKRYAASVLDNPLYGKTASSCLDIIDRRPPPSGICCCHNDVVAENLVDSGKLRLLDWEYAADNDPLFDLATPVAFHELDGTVSEGLLSAYLGGVTPEDRERLFMLSRLSDALHWLWLAQRQSISPTSRLGRRLDRLGARVGNLRQLR